MLWDCPRCGAKKLLGKTHRYCPGCGAAQDPSKRYFPSEEEKVAVEDHEFVGVDWVCAACDTPNAKATSFCVSCGAPADDNKVKSVATLGTVEAGQSGKEPPPPEPPEPEKKSGCFVLSIGCVPLLFIGIMLLMTFFCLNTLWTSDTKVTVTGHQWERSVEVETFREKSESKWCDEMPSDALSISRIDKKKSTKKVPDGEDCKTVNQDNGDGTMTQKQKCTTRYRDQPVMAKFCNYKVKKWVQSDQISVSGDLSTPLAWPQPTVSRCQELGCTRIGKKHETYTVNFVDSDGAKQSCELKEERWKSMADGSSWTAGKSVLSGSLNCGDLHQ